MNFLKIFNKVSSMVAKRLIPNCTGKGKRRDLVVPDQSCLLLADDIWITFVH